MLLQITAKCYYKLRQLNYKLRQSVIWCYYNYDTTLLQITACIINYDVITNYVTIYCSTTFRSSPSQMFFHNKCSLKFRSIHWKTSVLESLFNKLACLETPRKVFSCGYCEIFKNSFCYRTTPVVASEYFVWQLYLDWGVCFTVLQNSEPYWEPC